MIKPSQIREKEFSSSTMGGYKKSDVDSFLDEVAVSYEQLYKENSELLKKLRLLVDNIEDYRRREQNGEFTADETIVEARAQAERMVADARQQAEKIIAEASDSADKISQGKQYIDEIQKLRQKEEQSLAAIKAESEKFRKSLLSMYTEHLTLIQSMVDGEPTEQKDKAEKEKTHETKLDISSMEIDEKFTLDDIDEFFAEAVSDEQSRIREAFGGFRFEMGVESNDEVQLGIEENTSVFEEPVSDAEQEEVHSDIIVEFPSAETYEQEEQTDTDEDVKPNFKISFPEDEETGDNEEENLDDLFEGFFNSADKPE